MDIKLIEALLVGVILALVAGATGLLQSIRKNSISNPSYSGKAGVTITEENSYYGAGAP